MLVGSEQPETALDNIPTAMPTQPDPEIPSYQFDFWAPATSAVNLLIQSAEGEILKSRQRKMVSGLNKVKINFSEMPSGTYFLVMLDAESSQRWRFSI